MIWDMVVDGIKEFFTIIAETAAEKIGENIGDAATEKGKEILEDAADMIAEWVSSRE